MWRRSLFLALLLILFTSAQVSERGGILSRPSAPLAPRLLSSDPLPAGCTQAARGSIFRGATESEDAGQGQPQAAPQQRRPAGKQAASAAKPKAKSKVQPFSKTVYLDAEAAGDKPAQKKQPKCGRYFHKAPLHACAPPPRPAPPPQLQQCADEPSHREPVSAGNTARGTQTRTRTIPTPARRGRSSRRRRR